MIMNDYSLEELIPILKELTEKYTCKESTSISYEKANGLMGAIVYCINEFYKSNINEGSLQSKKIEATLAYQYGYEVVKKKVSKLRMQYNDIASQFKAYGNQNYEDTFIYGIPQFFLRYDPLFAPENQIITMDYPIIGKQPFELFSGVDAMEMYIQAIELEQKFFSGLSEHLIFQILNSLPINYKHYYFNICSIVLRNILISFTLKDKYPDKETEYETILTNLCLEYSKEKLSELLERKLEIFIQLQYNNDIRLFHYLKMDLSDFVVELKNSAKSNCLKNMIPILFVDK